MEDSANIITRLIDYEEDIRSNSFDFNKQLPYIFDFVYSKPILSKEYFERIRYFDNLIYENKSFKILTNNLRKHMVEYFKSCDFSKLNNDELTGLLKSIFPQYAYYTNPKNLDYEFYKVNNLKDFYKIFDSDAIWQIFPYSIDLNYNYTKNNWIGLSSIKYDFKAVEIQLLSKIKVCTKKATFNKLINEYKQITEIIPKTLKIRKFQFIECYKNTLKNHENFDGKSFIFPEPQEEKNLILLEVIRELKDILLKQKEEETPIQQPVKHVKIEDKEQFETIKIRFMTDGSVSINGKTTIEQKGKEKLVVSEKEKKVLRKLAANVGEYLTEGEITDKTYTECDNAASGNLRVVICKLNKVLNKAIDTQKGNKKLKTFTKYRLNKNKVEIIK